MFTVILVIVILAIVRPDFIENQIYDFYILRKNGLTISDITVQDSEVALVDMDALSEMITNNQVVERNTMYSALYDYLANEKKVNHKKR